MNPKFFHYIGVCVYVCIYIIFQFNKYNILDYLSGHFPKQFSNTISILETLCMPIIMFTKRNKGHGTAVFHAPSQAL